MGTKKTKYQANKELEKLGIEKFESDDYQTRNGVHLPTSRSEENIQSSFPWRVTATNKAKQGDESAGADFLRRLVYWLNSRDEHKNSNKSPIQLMNEFKKRLKSI